MIFVSEMTETKAAARAWLLREYLAPGAPSEALVECIDSQGGFDHVAALAERFAGQAWDPGPEAAAEAEAFALSSLVECHEGPHLPTCPDAWAT
jgi:hypothetical protein